MKQEGWKDGRFEDGSGEVIAACLEVHSRLGPGLLESIYEQCLALELKARGFRVERQREIALTCRDVRVEPRLRIDLVVDDLIEVKAVERLLPVHCAQVVTYLKL